jgi:hypothetical protein
MNSPNNSIDHNSEEEHDDKPLINVPDDKLPINIKAFSQTKMKKRAFKAFDDTSSSENVKNILKNL